MAQFRHISVLLEETIKGLNINPSGTYMDCTLGGAGYSLFIANKLNERGILIGIDHDEIAINIAKEKLKNILCKLIIVKENFHNLYKVLLNLGIKKIDGIVFDLGVSSYQLEQVTRGFSYTKNGPLDMRMNKDKKITAKEIINLYSEKKLYLIIKKYGEEKWAARIANFIVKARKIKKIETTFELVGIIKNAIPIKARQNGSHPAKRVFQALRIEVNSELEILESSLNQAINTLKQGGRICVVTFHSLEDRIVKNVFIKAQKKCICSKEIPFCICNKEALLKIIGKFIVPTKVELTNNPRSRSAKLRIAEKI